MNFIKLSTTEAKLFPIRRKSKRLINIKNNNNQKVISSQSVWKLHNCKLNKNFGIKKSYESEDSEELKSFSSESSSEKDEEETKEKKDKLSDEDSDNSKNSKNKGKEGYLYRISENGKLKKFWFKLINNHLFHFKNKDYIHSGLNCLIRVFIKESYSREINDKQYFCFSLIFGKKEREYLVDNEKDYLSWLKIFKKILHCENINDLYNIETKIGEGRYATVYKGIHKDSKRI